MKKVILITEASSGMGRETAKQLIAEGHKVYTVARRTDNMSDLEIAYELDFKYPQHFTWSFKKIT